MLYTLMCCLVFACGTRDYDTTTTSNEDKPEQATKKVKQVNQLQKTIVNKNISLHKKTKENENTIEQGYIWDMMSWVGVSNDNISEFKSELVDHEGTNTFNTFGTTLLGGAILGLVIRSSDSWFFGGPIPTKEGHWFWRKLNKTSKLTTQGLVRGGMFASGCHLALTGLNPISYDGLLGEGFTAMSASIILGGMSSLALSPYMNKIMKKDWKLNNLSGNPISQNPGFIRTTATNIVEWSKSSQLGKGIRYKLIPGISILGLGSGVGLIIYNYLQNNDQEEYFSEVAK